MPQPDRGSTRLPGRAVPQTVKRQERSWSRTFAKTLGPDARAGVFAVGIHAAPRRRGADHFSPTIDSLLDTLGAAAVTGRTALGNRAGAADLRLGRGTRQDEVRPGPLCAALDGFSLHAAVDAMPAQSHHPAAGSQRIREAACSSYGLGPGCLIGFVACARSQKLKP
jgi:hypothetical protein